MSFDFKFPDVGEGIQEGVIVKWKVKKGDKVKQDQVLAEVETDKAVVEIPSPKAGMILRLNGNEGETIKVGAVFVTIDDGSTSEKKGGASVVGFIEEAPEEAPEEKSKKLKSSNSLKPKKLEKSSNEKKLSMPKAKREARIGEPLSTTKSTSKHVRKYDFFGYVDRQPLQGTRKIIAERMMLSKSSFAQVTHFDEAEITKLYKLRKRMKPKFEKEGIKLTLLPFIIKAVIRGLQEFPYLNSSLEGEEILLKKYYNIGFAVDTGDGLVVPVIKEAQDKSIKVLSKEIVNFADLGRNKKLDPMMMKGGSFTITNIGSIGGLFATPLINPPESAIIGLGRAYEKPIVIKGKILIKWVLPLSLTFDHRLVDGAMAAKFVNLVKEELGDPARLLVEMD